MLTPVDANPIKIMFPVMAGGSKIRLGFEAEQAYSSWSFLVPQIYRTSAWFRVSVHWSKIQPEKSAPFDLSSITQKIGDYSGPIILTFKAPPYWAHEINGNVKVSEFPSLLAFMEYVTDSLEASGKDIRLIEIWNEPDMFTNYPSFGGYASNPVGYVELVQFLYTHFSRQEKLVSGVAAGNNDSWLEMVYPYLPTKFVSFHAYPELRYNNPFLIRRRANRIKGLAPGKILICSETSLISMVHSDPSAVDEAQRDYLTYLLENCKDLYAVIWYTIGKNGWAQSDLWQPGRQNYAYEIWKDYLLSPR